MAGAYSLGFTTVAAAAGAAYFGLRTGANLRARVQEIGVFVNAATASSVGLISPSNTPVGSTSQLGQAEDPADPASTVNGDTVWSTLPTIGSIFRRKMMIPATIGQGVIWAWPPGGELIVPVSSSLILWNYGGSAGSILNGYIKWLE